MPPSRNEFRFNWLVLCCLSTLLLTAAGLRGEEVQPSFLVRVWRSENGLPSNRVRSVVQAADGWLWVGTAEGVVRFDGIRFSGFKQEQDETLAQWPVRALFALPNGDVWISAVNDGLLHWHAGRLHMVWPDDKPGKSGASNPSVDNVVDDGSGGTLIVHGPELWRVKGQEAPVRVERTPGLEALLGAKGSSPREPAGAVRNTRDSRGRFWKVTGQDISVTDTGGKASSIALPSLEPDTQISELLEDREGNMWIASSDGLIEVCPRLVDVVSFEEGRTDRHIRAVLEDRSGALWVSTRDRGLIRRAEGVTTRFDVDKLGAGREIVALCEDQTGSIWAARNVGSVLCTDGGELRPAPLGRGTRLSKVMAMVEDPRGRIWFGDGKGLAVWDGKSVIRCAVPRQAISALALDAAGAVWAGTRNGLVFRSRELAVEPVGAVPTSRGISGLLPEADGSVWVSTIGSGLHHLVGGRCFRFSAEQGLPDARLTCVLDDAFGRLWLGSLSGILAVAKSDLVEIESGHNKTAYWIEFDRADGMLASECAGGPQPAGCRGRNGQLWFATADGVALIRPEQVSKNRVPPAVQIEQVSVNGRVVSLTNNVVQAGPGRTQLGFFYAGLSFTAPGKVRFRAWLEGLETGWQELGDERHVAYDSVSPGKYRFHIIAANRDGVWNEQGDTVEVEVLPHFWERTSVRAGAGLLAVVAATAAGWGVARARLKRRLARLQLQSAREAERARIAQDLHDDLGASLTHISLFANMAVENARAGADATQVLPEIADKVQALVGTLDEIVWTVNPRYDTLAAMAEYLTASAAELLGAAGIALRLEVPRELPAATLDAEQRHSLFLAAREALNNAAKHSGASEVQLRLSVADRSIEITVQDNGRGFDVKSASRGEGLRNLHERMAAIGGRCGIESTLGAGTCVRLSLPLPSANNTGS